MRRTTVLLAFAVVVLALGLASGCGGAEDVAATPETIEGTVPEPENGGGGEDLPALDLKGDPAAGKTVWDANGCGACHVLAAAGSAGQVGPSLDATPPSYELVVTRVTNGLGAMPAFGERLTPQQIADVSQFVADNAGG